MNCNRDFLSHQSLNHSLRKSIRTCEIREFSTASGDKRSIHTTCRRRPADWTREDPHRRASARKRAPVRGVLVNFTQGRVDSGSPNWKLLLGRSVHLPEGAGTISWLCSSTADLCKHYPRDTFDTFVSRHRVRGGWLDCNQIRIHPLQKTRFHI